MFADKVFCAVVLCSVLSACGGGAGGGGPSVGSLQDFSIRLAELQNDPTLGSRSMQSTVDARSGTVNYSGVVNVTTDDPSNPAGATFYYGNISVDVAFGSDTISGEAGQFVLYGSQIASPNVGSSVPGSLTITGGLGADNETIGDGITGVATGSIDNYAVVYDVDGNITGVNANGMLLSLDGIGSGGGVALLIE